MYEEPEMLRLLREHDANAFGLLVCTHAGDMATLAFSVLHDRDKANVIVDEVLFRLWYATDLSKLAMPLQQWLYTQVLDACKTCRSGS